MTGHLELLQNAIATNDIGLQRRHPAYTVLMVATGLKDDWSQRSETEWLGNPTDEKARHDDGLRSLRERR